MLNSGTGTSEAGPELALFSHGGGGGITRFSLAPYRLSTNQAETWHTNQLSDQYENPTLTKKFQQLNSCQQLLTADENKIQPRELKFGTHITFRV